MRSPMLVDQLKNIVVHQPAQHWLADVYITLHDGLKRRIMDTARHIAMLPCVLRCAGGLSRIEVLRDKVEDGLCNSLV